MDFRVCIEFCPYVFESITADNWEQAEKIALECLKDTLADDIKIRFIETTDNNEIS